MSLKDLYIPKGKFSSIVSFIVIGIMTLIVAFGMVNIELDNDVSVLLPINSETEHEREKIRMLSGEFPSEQMLFIAVTGNIKTPEQLKILKEMTDKIEKLDVVKSIMSPFNGYYFEKINDFFSFNRVSSNRTPVNEEEINEFLAKLNSNRYLVGSVIAYDNNSFGIVVRMNSEAQMGKFIPHKNLMIKFLEFVFGKEYGPKKIDRSFFCNEIVEEIKPYYKNFEIHIAGIPYFEYKSKQMMQKDIFILIIPAMILMAIVLFLNFKTKRGVILPMLCIGLALLWTMGLLSWFRYKINVLTMILPPIIMTIGSSYTLHYLQSYYYNVSNFSDPRSLVLKASKDIWPTISMAGVTTIFGFASFLTAAIMPVKFFGVFVIISILLTLFFTFVLLGRILAIIPIATDIKVEKIKTDIFSKILDFIKRIVIPYRFVFIITFVASIVLMIIFIPTIKVNTDATKLFRKGGDVRNSIVYMQTNYKGSSHYNITIRSKNNKRNYFRTVEGLKAAEKIQDYFDNNVVIDGHTMIGWNISPVTLIQDLNFIMTGVRRVPDNERTIKRFFTLLTLSGDEGIKSLINKDFSAINFQVRGHTSNKVDDYVMTEKESNLLITKMKNDLGLIAKEDGDFVVEIWGEVLLLTNISQYLLKDQKMNIIITSILVFVVILIIFRSFYFALIGIIPMAFGVIMNFLIMAIFKIPLDAATVLISAIAIGIGIDDSIHFILNYRKVLLETNDVKIALANTLDHTSRPILFTSIALAVGFMVFLLSSFKPVFNFGLLIAVAMVNCTFATLFILPAVFYVTDKLRISGKRKNNEK